MSNQLFKAALLLALASAHGSYAEDKKAEGVKVFLSNPLGSRLTVSGAWLEFVLDGVELGRAPLAELRGSEDFKVAVQGRKARVTLVDGEQSYVFADLPYESPWFAKAEICPRVDPKQACSYTMEFDAIHNQLELRVRPKEGN